MTLTAEIGVASTPFEGSGDLRFSNDITFTGTEYGSQAAPQTATGTAVLTAAQMTGGILVGTPAATANYTTLTGTLLEAALSSTIATDDTFDLCIINLGVAGDIITLVGGTGVTVVGSATVDDAGTDINSSGVFRFRRSAANTFIAYRIS